MTSVTTRRHLLGSLGAFAVSAFVPSAQATSDQRTASSTLPTSYRLARSAPVKLPCESPHWVWVAWV